MAFDIAAATNSDNVNSGSSRLIVALSQPLSLHTALIVTLAHDQPRSS